ncbi:MAG: peptidoglycan editing factor PgeF [Bacteroidales bacterium]|nr:peptidoglycan editing factor PgeF [Bacteroidales bacterium]
MTALLRYNFNDSRVEAFSTYRDSELPYFIVTGHQVHGTAIAVVDNPATTRDELEGYDALITNVPGCVIGVRTADCIPVLLYDPVTSTVAAVHSGWKGTLNRISQKTIMKMRDTFGSDPHDIRAVIGPGICSKCFQVGEEVVNYFKGNGIDIVPIYSWDGPKQEGSMAGGHHLDLVEENRILLVESGVRPENIQLSGICTYEDGRFFSARREGSGCGRIINAIKLL